MASRQKLEAASWFAVVHAYEECRRRYSQMMKAFGLTVPQFDVMSAIARLGDAAQPKVIADDLVVTRGNITGVLHRLEENGLLRTRSNKEDGRSFICELTADGMALLEKARAAGTHFIREQLAPFDDAALRHTEEQMNAMHDHLQTIDPDRIVARIAATA
ncbi:MAG: MarR family transcriptional regulator [Pseudomonadota bacterium]